MDVQGSVIIKLWSAKTLQTKKKGSNICSFCFQAVDIRQIYDKFPEKKGGLKELYDKGPQSAFFLVKFWVRLFYTSNMYCSVLLRC